MIYNNVSHITPLLSISVTLANNICKLVLSGALYLLSASHVKSEKSMTKKLSE